LGLKYTPHNTFGPYPKTQVMNLKNPILKAHIILVILTSCSPEVDETTNISEEDFLVENVHRTSIGLPALIEHATTETVALSHSNYMAIKNTPSHDNFYQRSDFLQQEGAQRVSENVAYGYQTAEGALQGWLDNPDHKAALEGNFTHTGIAIVASENGIKYYTQLFTKQ